MAIEKRPLKNSENLEHTLPYGRPTLRQIVHLHKEVSLDSIVVGRSVDKRLWGKAHILDGVKASGLDGKIRAPTKCQPRKCIWVAPVERSVALRLRPCGICFKKFK